jgi:hypothetical protein
VELPRFGGHLSAWEEGSPPHAEGSASLPA